MKNRAKKILLWIGITVIGLIILCLLLGWIVFNRYYNMLDYYDYSDDKYVLSDAGEDYISDFEGVESFDEDIEKYHEEIQDNLKQEKKLDLDSKEMINILLLGVDATENQYSGRTDMIMLLTINKKENKICLTSIQRDTYLAIPEEGYDRINMAYAQGGVPLLQDTLKENFGIEAEDYVCVNIFAVMDFIDLIGGIDVELTSEEMDVMNEWYIRAHNISLGNPEGTDYLPVDNPGTYHLNGNQAVAYSRVRFVGSDFARTSRQREVLQLSFEKVKDMSILELNNMLEELLPKIRTDMTQKRFLELMGEMVNLSDYSWDTMTIPADGTWENGKIEGKDVLLIDFKKNIELWMDFVR